MGNLLDKIMIVRKNYVIAVETRKNVFVLAQSMGNYTLVFFNCFSKNINEFANIDLNKTKILCSVTVLPCFFKECNIQKINIKRMADTIKYNTNNGLAYDINYTWERKKIYKGTKDEMEVLYKKGNFRLINDKFKTLKVLDKKKDKKLIENNQVETMGVNWALNEKLYLSYKCGKYVEPMKDLTMGKKIPIEYKTYYEIIMGKITGSKYKKL
jgi:hypothetical protein